MNIQDIRLVLELAKMMREQAVTQSGWEERDKAIAAVEAWLAENANWSDDK